MSKCHNATRAEVHRFSPRFGKGVIL